MGLCEFKVSLVRVLFPGWPGLPVSQNKTKSHIIFWAKIYRVGWHALQNILITAERLVEKVEGLEIN